MLVLLLGLSACKLQVEDTAANGLKWGNTLATEQGKWIALRGEKDGEVGVLLFDKKKEKSEMVIEGDLYHIALLGNKLYYKYLQGSELYSYDLAEKEQTELLSGVMAYQIHGDTIYYIDENHDTWLYAYNLQTAETQKITMKHTVNAFWITDYGIYYHDDSKNLLIVRPFEKDLESIIYRGIYEDCRDVIQLNEKDIAFMVVSESVEKTTLCTYNAEQAKTTEHFEGNFTHFNLVGDRLVTVNGTEIVSVDYTEGKVYSWGDIGEYIYPQIMSDCMVLYEDEDGKKPVVRYYPEEE